MNRRDMARIKAIEKRNKERILSVCPTATEDSGIYFMKRTDGTLNYAYVGQAKHLLSRLAGHLTGFQHIDLSIKKHGLYDKDKNPYGWNIGCMEAPLDKLDELEQKYIAMYGNAGYQLRNETLGGQGEGKKGIDVGKSPKTYKQGVQQGYKNACRDIAHLFSLHLNYSAKRNPPTKNQEKALQKFADILIQFDEKKEQK